MFHNIPPLVQQRMSALEAVDAIDRLDGTPKARRLRQIPPETGKLLALLAAGAPPGLVLEIGTSGGYSSLWLTLACRERGDRLVTFEEDVDKVSLARQTFHLTGVEHLVQVVQGNALDLLPQYPGVAFCFLDIEKDAYLACYQSVVPNLVPGGLLCADNVISHASELEQFLEDVHSDSRLDALVVPVGKGVLVCRKSRHP
jgi:predicted O-methyltransferase YrrM